MGCLEKFPPKAFFYKKVSLDEVVLWRHQAKSIEKRVLTSLLHVVAAAGGVPGASLPASKVAATYCTTAANRQRHNLSDLLAQRSKRGLWGWRLEVMPPG
jgi:hypothetical protein